MRNIICISLALGSTMGFAQEPPMGCFERTYGAAHLRENPGQIVARLSISFGVLSDIVPLENSVDAPPIARVQALMAGTPSTLESGVAGRYFSEALVCFVKDKHPTDEDWIVDGALTCVGDCDGGYFQVLPSNAGELLIRTDRVRLTACGNPGDTAFLGDETDGPTTYKLFAAPQDACLTDID